MKIKVLIDVENGNFVTTIEHALKHNGNGKQFDITILKPSDDLFEKINMIQPGLLFIDGDTKFFLKVRADKIAHSIPTIALGRDENENDITKTQAVFLRKGPFEEDDVNTCLWRALPQ